MATISSGLRYRYLYPQARTVCAQKPRDDRDVLSKQASLKDVLAGACVVRDEGGADGQSFRLFPDTKSFWAWESTLPETRRNFHEVIFSQQPQRLKFDIDAVADDIAQISPEVLDRVVPKWRDLRGSTISDENLNLHLNSILYGGNAAAPPTRVTAPPPSHEQKAEGVLTYLVGLIMDLFESRYRGEALTLNDIIVASSLLPADVPRGSAAPGTASTPMKQKFSYHILVAPFLVANHHEAQAFTNELLAELRLEAPELVGLVDPQVNRSTQNFRLTGSQKPGSGRPKIVDAELARRLGTKVVPEPAGPATMVTRAPGARTLPVLLDPELGQAVERPKEALTGDDEQKILALIKETIPGTFAAHRFRRRMGTLFMFERERPSACRLCRRVHDNDNTLMVSVAPAGTAAVGAAADDGAVPGDYTSVVALELCRHAPAKSQQLGAVRCSRGAFPTLHERRQANAQNAEAEATTRLQKQIAAIREGRRNPHAACDHLFDMLPPERKQVYNEPNMRPYEVVPTLAVKAQVGVGKTRQLRNYLDTHFPVDASGLAPPAIIRFVTFRQTFSESLRRAFPEFRLYNDVSTAQISAAAAPRLVIQVESLHRLLNDCCTQSDEGGRGVDLLILDEVESVLAQFSSGLHKSFNESFTVIQSLLATAGRVICMDANISDRTFRTLQRMRPQAPAHFHWNAYSRAGEDTVHVTANRNVWLDQMFSALARDHRIAFASNSLSEAKTVIQVLQGEFPNKRMKLYSSETPQAEKNLHFADVDKYWSVVDVLAYTPTVSAGVSYEVPAVPGTTNGFDSMFVYLTDRSCDVETARQMLGRVRSLRSKSYYVCLRSFGGTFPTDIATLERLVYERRQLIASDFRQAQPPTMEFDPASGQVRPYRSAYFPLWLETCRITNLSRNGFAERFIDQVADTGARVALLEADPGRAKDIASLGTRRRAASAALKEAEATGIADAPDLTSEEVADIRRRMDPARAENAAQEVSEKERSAVRRFFLRARYAWTGEINTRFALTYTPPAVQALFSNLEFIMSCSTEEEAVAMLHEREQRAFSAAAISRQNPNLSVRASNRLEHGDLRRKYHFPGHFYAIWFLRLCGFRSILDPASVCAAWLYARLTLARRVLVERMPNILHEFELRHPGHRQLNSDRPDECGKALLRLMNSVLRKKYGVEIRKDRRTTDGSGLCLSRTKPAKALGWPGDPEDPTRPQLSSQLRPVDTTYDSLLAFVVWSFYSERYARRSRQARAEVESCESSLYDLIEEVHPRILEVWAGLPSSVRAGDKLGPFFDYVAAALA